MQPAPQGQQPSEALATNAWLWFRNGTWEQHEPSPYAWMSVPDGESFKAVLLNAANRNSRPLRVLEWGAGKSTLSFTKLFGGLGIPFYWLALEYDRDFCDSEIAPELLRRPATVLRYMEDDRVLTGVPGSGSTIEVVCWNSAALRPFMGDEFIADRAANLDAYVNYPAVTKGRFDVIMVDGRKRRRCLLAALDLMTDHSVVLLHDAYRTYYHCATGAYPASRFFGDALWIGALDNATLSIALQGQDKQEERD